MEAGLPTRGRIHTATCTARTRSRWSSSNGASLTTRSSSSPGPGTRSLPGAMPIRMKRRPLLQHRDLRGPSRSGTARGWVGDAFLLLIDDRSPSFHRRLGPRQLRSPISGVERGAASAARPGDRLREVVAFPFDFSPQRIASRGVISGAPHACPAAAAGGDLGQQVESRYVEHRVTGRTINWTSKVSTALGPIGPPGRGRSP